MKQVTVSRIRPISWKVCVKGKEEAEYVRGVLSGQRIESTECRQEPDLGETPIYSFVASATVESTLTSAELQAILENDDRIEVSFDATEPTR